MLRINPYLVPMVMVFATGCASLPDGPSVLVLPGAGHTFEQFRIDDANCQQYAYTQVGGVTPNQASVHSGLATAAVGTALGAAAGAALSGGAGGAAAAGAGAGLVAGSLAGTSSASTSGYASQQRYDAAYIQCMYAKGHQVPVSGQFSNVVPRQPETQPVNIPPPPAGSPPPPTQ